MTRIPVCRSGVLRVLFLMTLMAAPVYASPVEGELGLSAGYRVDNFNWNIAGYSPLGNYVNVLSELTWSDLRIFQVAANGKALFGETLYFRGMAGYGTVLEGDQQDSDYGGDGRAMEFSRSNNDGGDGSTLDASIGAGYRFGTGRFNIIPLVGYSHHEQRLRAKDGYQTVSAGCITADVCLPPPGPIEGLNSTYDAKWEGFWTGLDFSFAPVDALAFHGSLEYHQASYRAESDWNLREDFAHPVSYVHEADGEGGVISLGGSYEISERWLIGLNINYQDWKAGPGVDWTFLADGVTAVPTPLNEVNWDSRAVMLGLKYRFRT